MTEESEVLERIDVLQTHMKALDAFLASDAYVGYLAAQNVQIENLQTLILGMLPNSEANIAILLGWHGELTAQTQMKTVFEDARVTLKDRIDKLVEQKTQNASNRKV